MILDELLAIPADATNATVQGVEMKVISNERAEMLLNDDAEDEKTHECILKNGRFLFESENGELKALYKVVSLPFSDSNRNRPFFKMHS